MFNWLKGFVSFFKTKPAKGKKQSQKEIFLKWNLKTGEAIWIEKTYLGFVEPPRLEV